MIRPHHGMTPKVDPTAFVVESAQIIGDVEIGKQSSVWFNAVIRGDVNSIRIGDRTNVQDNCVLHVQHREYALSVGSDVTLGHGVILHGCTVADCCLVGMGAIVLNNAEIASHSLVAAGSVVREDAKFPAGVLIAGVPAMIVRDLTNAERFSLEQSAKDYMDYVKTYR